MAINDLVSNYLTRIRNAIMAKHETVTGIPASNLIEQISKVLKDEGYISDYRIVEIGPKKTVSVDIKYYKGVSVITKIERISRPGIRVYAKTEEIPYVRAGLGISVISTSKGVFSDKKAREMNVGGEIICRVW